MIDLPYLCFTGCILFLLVFATNRDRNALRIVFAASVVGELAVVFITRQIHAPWKLAIPGAIETLTILALLSFGRNRTAYIQAVLLLIAWCAHLQCYLDIQFGTNVVYDHYEQIIAGVAIGQLVGFHDTAFHIGRSVQRRCYVWANGRGLVSPASAGSAMVRIPVDPAK